MQPSDSIFDTLEAYFKQETIVNLIVGQVKNKIKDLLDESYLETLNGVNPEAEVTSIHKDNIRSINPDNIFQETEHYRLSNFIQKLPHGIIDKKATGIGATTLEIKSPRHSIIVLPTKKLAYNKYKWVVNNLGNGRALYIGSAIGEFTDKVSTKEIIRYIQLNDTHPKKFLVVADSLDYFINAVGKEVYKACFLMVDEIDLLQADSNYRPSLETVIDHYFKFNVKNRCIVTATMGDFSNPQFQDECKFSIDDLSHKTRDIRLIYVGKSESLNFIVKAEIESKPSKEKIVIAYNTIKQATQIIFSLQETLQAECAILCSESSKSDAGTYYESLAGDFSLPRRINFITSSYFSGVDIEDSYHLITVSSVKYAHQMLSPKKITQIYGRCRIEGGILSDTIIYNTTEHASNFTRTSKSYKKILLKRSDKVLSLLDSADKIQGDDSDLANLFGVMRDAISDKAVEYTFRGSFVPLVRKNIDGKYVPAYLNIDYLVERDYLINKLYISFDALYNILVKERHNVDVIALSSNETVNAKEALFTCKATVEKTFTATLLLNTITSLKEAEASLKPINFRKYLFDKIKNSTSRNERVLLERFQELSRYADSDTLLTSLYNIWDKNGKAYKGLHNAVLFWALAESHPLRISIQQAFEIGEEYLPEEVYLKMEVIVKYHFHKTINKRASISLFKAYFRTERPRSTYRVLSENPSNFQTKKVQINKRDNRLVRYFYLD